MKRIIVPEDLIMLVVIEVLICFNSVKIPIKGWARFSQMESFRLM